jgi:hypothetical protein
VSGKSLRLAIGTTAAGLALLAGGLLFGGTLVSAQEPTPSATEQAAPSTPQDRAPGDDNAPRDKAECDKDGDGQPDGASGSGTGIRSHGGPRTFAQ